MRKDIHSALLSVGEVAVFALSLLELLLTRILPLAGFLAGHLLLHFCRFLASNIVGLASAGCRRKPARGEYSYQLQPAEDQPLEESRGQYNNNDDWQDDQYEESLNDRQRQQLIFSSDEADHAIQVGDAAAAAQRVDYLHVVDSTSPSDAAQNIIDSRPSDLIPGIDEEGRAPMMRPSTQSAEQQLIVDDPAHIPDSTPSTDAKIIDIIRSPLSANLPANGGAKAAVSNQALVYIESGRPLDLGCSGDDVVVGGDHMLKSELSDELGSSDGQSTKEGGATTSSGSLEVSPSTNAEAISRDGSKTRSSTRGRVAPRMQVRVLPPSLSQIKRTLMQRSRRSSPPQSKTSPFKPSTKKQSPRPRKFVSALKSSTSTDNFMRKFRKHFLLGDST